MQIKDKYKNCLLFYRLGDFYELFFDDALIASKELEITLTGKSCGLEEKAPMCGVPFHSADGYIARLVEKGYKVAICEQIENPKETKGIVARDVVRIVTPGTVLDTKYLEDGKNNYIMCIYKGGIDYGIALCDVTTGEFQVMDIASDFESKIIDEIARFMPSEIICNSEFDLKEKILRVFDINTSIYTNSSFNYSDANIFLCNHFKVINLSGFGIEKEKSIVCAAGALLQYLIDTQKNQLANISSIKLHTPDKFMVLDISSRRNLELTQTMREKSKKGSLLWVLDETKTSMGARLLRSWVEQPLIQKEDIQRRLDAVEELKNDNLGRKILQDLLKGIYDIERLMSKVVYGSVNARELIALKNSFKVLPEIKSYIKNYDCKCLKDIYENFDTLKDICELIEESISDEPPVSLREGMIIKDGYSEEVDRLRSAKKEGSSWLLELERKEKEETGISKLRIKYNKVFGYFIEVTNSYKDMVPQRYIRKQTLANAERYITEELKEIEDTILGADEKVVLLEYELFTKIRELIAINVEKIQEVARFISEIDTLQSLAEVAENRGYSKPTISKEQELYIEDGKHPVVEKIIGDEFIANNSKLDNKNYISVITGPNMAGKSTFMRQNALIVLMAQMGSFVPAKSAKIGIVDRIFTRVGASDDLATGQSTFMVEMLEVANILNNATSKSLLILDEIGRGTSTFDGLSIAWAVLEYIANKICARTLFSTHYHELIALEGKVKGIKNYYVSVKEIKNENNEESIIFLRKILEGGTDKSYGIHVAKIAGVPRSVIKRSNSILKLLSEEKGVDLERTNFDFDYINDPLEEKLVFFDDIINDIERIDLENITPLEAMKKLFTLKDKLNSLDKEQ